MPVTATYFAAVDSSLFDIKRGYADIFYKNIQSEKIKNNTPIENYAAFFGKGIPLYDNSLYFANEDSYFGFVSHGNDIELTFYEPVTIDNGITVVFDRCSCYKIEISYSGDNLVGAKEIEDENRPLVWYIPLRLDEEIQNLKIKFLDFSENELLTLKGVILGKVIEMDKFFDFDYLSEVKPLGDDLPLSQVQTTAYNTETFIPSTGQKVVFFDNEDLLEETFLSELITEKKDKYNLISQNIISRISDADTEYAYTVFDYPVEDWNELSINASATLVAIDNLNFAPDYIYPEWFNDYKLSQFLKPDKARKILQQIAWACCCGIRTNKKTNTVEFVPFLAENNVVPDVVISNEDGRILKSQVTKGEVYKKIIWEITEYAKSDTEETLGKIKATKSSLGDYEWKFSVSTPIYFTGFENASGWLVERETPYVVSGRILLDSEGQKEQTALGYSYTPIKRQIEIDLPNKSQKTYTISNQDLYPLNPERKIEQLKKWYSKNNTLSATIVDNGDIHIGDILKIQLENEEYFTGIITKIERNNVSDYHVLEVEAHEWD